MRRIFVWGQKNQNKFIPNEKNKMNFFMFFHREDQKCMNGMDFFPDFFFSKIKIEDDLFIVFNWVRKNKSHSKFSISAAGSHERFHLDFKKVIEKWFKQKFEQEIPFKMFASSPLWKNMKFFIFKKIRIKNPIQHCFDDNFEYWKSWKNLDFL